MADLRSIRAYTLERWGSAQETADLDRMWAKFESILANPALHRARPDLFPAANSPWREST